MSNKLRVALKSPLGWMGEQHAKVLIKLMQQLNNEYELYAVISRSPQEAINKIQELGGHEVRAYSTLDECLMDDDVDLVVLADPTYLHASETEKALDAGKDVFVEKSAIIDGEEALSIYEAMKRNPQGRVAVDYVMKAHPVYAALVKGIRNISMGSPNSTYAKFSHAVGLNQTWKFEDDEDDRPKMGNAWCQAFCHAGEFISYLLHLVGDYAKKVYAETESKDGNPFNDDNYWHLRIETAQGNEWEFEGNIWPPEAERDQYILNIIMEWAQAKLEYFHPDLEGVQYRETKEGIAKRPYQDNRLPNLHGAVETHPLEPTYIMLLPYFQGNHAHMECIYAFLFSSVFIAEIIGAAADVSRKGSRTVDLDEFEVFRKYKQDYGMENK